VKKAAYTFLHHPKTRIDALIKRIFELDDIVFRKALDSVDQTSPSARALAIFLAVRYTIMGEAAYSTESLFGEATLRRVYERLRIRQEELLDATRQAATDRVRLHPITPYAPGIMAGYAKFRLRSGPISTLTH
jgi:hypothetical protein